jgi:hypothetical protein
MDPIAPYLSVISKTRTDPGGQAILFPPCRFAVLSEALPNQIPALLPQSHPSRSSPPLPSAGASLPHPTPHSTPATTLFYIPPPTPRPDGGRCRNPRFTPPLPPLYAALHRSPPRGWTRGHRLPCVATPPRRLCPRLDPAPPYLGLGFGLGGTPAPPPPTPP